MEEARSRDHAGENTLHRFDLEMRVKIRERAVGENQPDIEPDQRTAAPENKTHEPADGPVLLHAVAIINPDKRQILDVVKNFKESDASEDVGHAVVAIPPE